MPAKMNKPFLHFYLINSANQTENELEFPKHCWQKSKAL